VLGGSPRLTLTDSAGNVLRSTSAEGSPPIAVILDPGDTASAPVRFSNWCGSTSGSPKLEVELPGDLDQTGALDSASVNGISYPPCLGSGQPALLEIKGWTS